MCYTCCSRVTHLAWCAQAQATPHLRHVVELSETGNDSSGRVHSFRKPGIGIAISGSSLVNCQSMSHARPHQEEVPQVAETSQEAGTGHTHHITDVGVPCNVAVEQNANVFDALAVLNGSVTDPHADW